MDRIQVQATKLKELLFSKETAETYQDALQLTGDILKESAQLIWLIIISIFVFGAWVSDTAIKTGNSIRTWVDNYGEETGEAGEKKELADTGKELLASARISTLKLLNQAREQLGIEPLEISEPKPAIAKPATPKAAAPKAAAPKAAAPKAAPAPKPTSPSPAVASTEADTADETGSDDEDDNSWPPKVED